MGLYYNYLIDPLTTIIKLAILSYKPIGTKLSIRDNSINIHEHSILKTFIRYYLGDSKDDLRYIYIPIEIACKKYLTEEMIQKYPKLIKLFKYAKSGLFNLIRTYDSSNKIVFLLKCYYSTIESYMKLLEPKPKPKLKPITKQKDNRLHYGSTGIYYVDDNFDQLEMQEFKYDMNIPLVKTDTEKEIFLLYSEVILYKFELFWLKSKIDIMLNMLDLIDTQYINCIETFMDSTDKELYDIIYKYLYD